VNQQNSTLPITQRIARWSVGLLAACLGCSEAKSPVQPTPAPISHVRFSLSGWVHDTAYRTIDGVRIDAVDGPGTSAVVSSDAQGRFELPGDFSDAVTIHASKDGYAPYTTRYGTRYAGRQTLDIILDVVNPSVDLTGHYTLTLTADGSCSQLPEAARSRTFETTIAVGRSSTPHQFQGVLEDGPFYSSVGSNQFQVGVSGTFAQFNFGDPYDDGSMIVEELAPLTYLAIWGTAGLTVGAATISGSLDGAFEYCAAPSPPVVGGNLFRCPVQPIRCASAHHRVLLMRR